MKKSEKLLATAKTAVTLIYTLGLFLCLVITQMANDRWRLDLDGWFWFGALVFYLLFFPSFASLTSILQTSTLKVRYGAVKGFHRALRVFVYSVASASALASIFVITALRSFDGYFYVFILLSALSLVITVIDSAYCRFKAKKLLKTEP